MEDSGKKKLCGKEYGLSKMRFNSLKAAVPPEMKLFFITTSPITYRPTPPHNYDLLHHSKSVTRIIYRYFTRDELRVHGKYIKWIQELGPQFCDGFLDFVKKHMNIYRGTNVAKLRSFQYRLLQRGLVTNVQLSKWGIKSNCLCYFL